MSARHADISTFSPDNEIFAVPMSIQQPDLFASGGVDGHATKGISECWKGACGRNGAASSPADQRSSPLADGVIPSSKPEDTCHSRNQARPARKSTSTLALESVDAKALASLCLSALKEAGPMTPDETARNLGLSILSIRPRMTELSKAGLIAKTGVRRANVSGCNANEWRAV